MMSTRSRKTRAQGQSMIEYSIVIAVVVAALITMRIFLVRSVQQRYRQSADVFGQGEQYAENITDVTSLDGALSAGVPLDSCPYLLPVVETLKERLQTIIEQAGTCEQQAQELEQQIAQLEALSQSVDMQNLIARLRENLQSLRDQRVALLQRAEQTQGQIDAHKNEHPECFQDT